MASLNKSRQQIPHQCDICDKKFKKQIQLSSHVKITHESKKLYKCDSCGKALSQAWVLKKHINSVHNGQKSLHRPGPEI